MKLQGVFQSQIMQILVNSGSTNNFLDVSLASKLNIIPDCTKSMEVVVANGEELKNSGFCKSVSWTVQGSQLKVNFHLLPFKGYDIVLDIQWFNTLGPVLWDFLKLHMSFHYNKQELLMEGIKKSPLKIGNSKQIVKTIVKAKQGVLQITALLDTFFHKW